ncbi:amidohydrolase family protein [Streptomyces niveus]|uniref:amidohydrolase family protein n=1 Tax=Streptomyces niveus TaxID=193462 RepID=UPI0039A62BC4
MRRQLRRPGPFPGRHPARERLPRRRRHGRRPVAGAFACHWEDTLGSLAPGKAADLVVLGDDPRRVDPSRIGDIEVVATYVDGVEVGPNRSLPDWT